MYKVKGFKIYWRFEYKLWVKLRIDSLTDFFLFHELIGSLFFSSKKLIVPILNFLI